MVWLLENLKAPVVRTLHTVWPSFPPAHHGVFLEVLRRSSKLLVFSEIAFRILQKNYGVATEKVEVVPHGVPEVPFRRPTEVQLAGLPARGVKFISFGLLRQAKGVENALAAFAEVKKTCPDFAYIVCGSDHPKNAGASEY